MNGRKSMHTLPMCKTETTTFGQKRVLVAKYDFMWSKKTIFVPESNEKSRL